MSLKDRVNDLIEHIKAGKIIDAMNRFYAPDLSMQENRNPPTVGLEANIKREEEFLAGVKEWKNMAFHAVATDGDENDGVACIEYAFDFINTDDEPVHYEQVSVQRWKNNRIVSERFYYDSGN